MRKLPMIDDKVILKQKIDLLDVLGELDIANKYLNIAYEDVRILKINFRIKIKTLQTYFINY